MTESWERVPAELRERAERVCTPRQLQVLRLVHEHGESWRRIGRILDLHPATVIFLPRRSPTRISRNESHAHFAQRKGIGAMASSWP